MWITLLEIVLLIQVIVLSLIYQKRKDMTTTQILHETIKSKLATRTNEEWLQIGDYGDYLLLKKDNIEIHFFEFKSLNPEDNYGQVYIRTNAIASLYQFLLDNKVSIHPNAPLQNKPWGQKEFALLDPDNNLLTFGESL